MSVLISNKIATAAAKHNVCGHTVVSGLKHPIVGLVSLNISKERPSSSPQQKLGGVKLLLCYVMLLYHKSIQKSGSTAPPFSASARDGCSLVAYTARNIRRYRLHRKLGQPERRSRPSGEGKNHLPLPGINSVPPVSRPQLRHYNHRSAHKLLKHS